MLALRSFAVGGLLTLSACSARPRLDAVVGQRVTPNSAQDPGNQRLQRLNRSQYDRTVHELLGTEQRLASTFPGDDHGFGFDNNAGVLSISPMQFQLYERAAAQLAAEALAPAPTGASVRVVEGENLHSPFGGQRATAFNLASNGTLSAPFELPAQGRYRVSVRAWGEQAGLEVVRMRVSAAGRELLTTDVPQVANAPGTFAGELPLAAGANAIDISFLNDGADKTLRLERNLLVDSITVEGPLDSAAEAAARRAHVLVCDPVSGGEPCLRRSLEQLATRAFRRPLRSGEVERLLALVKSADGVEHGMALAVQAILLSPHFLFRPELDAQPSSPIVRRLNGWELASRLSYFLWSSMPDRALFEAAESGELDTPKGVTRQAERLLADPRSRALVDDFAGQWLLLRALPEHEVDGALTGFDERTRSGLSRETSLFVGEFLHQPLPVEGLLTARFSFLDDNLARYYGLSVRPGASFAKVELSTKERGGLLRQGALLTVTSLPHRSSAVKRGKWVLGQLLCSEPPPPPPGVPQIPHQDLSKASLREILKAHRANAECAVCHDVLDPIGLALENYDAIGRYRSTDHGEPVDSRGVMPDGTRLSGPEDLSRLIANDPRFPACVAEKLYVYALGRGLELHDRQELERMLKDLGTTGFSLPELITEVVQSNGFRYRRGEVASP